MKLPLALFHFLSIFSLLCSNSASAQCLDNQKSSLLSLFGSAPTPFWTPSTDCCLWKGITSDRSGHVTGLDLTSHSISAPINSTSLTFLSSPRIFNLSHNAVRGNIPSSLFRLPTLQYLNLSNNLFDAPLDELNLPSLSLKSLDLSNNRLRGPIPTSLFQLKGLRTLSLSSNKLKGTVHLFMLQNIKNLSSLDLSNNRLSINTSGINTSFPQIGNLKLSSCNLREFPDFLRNQLRLSTLDLSYNKIDGEIPNWVWRIGNGSLKHLNLSHNMVDSLQPPGVDLSLSKLNVLDLHANMLQGSMPIPPPSIVVLDYSGNNLTSKSSLLTLFGSAQIPSWTANTNCCLWKGVVTCESSTGHVTGLDLANHSISAPINSTSLISLSGLVPIELSLIKSLESLGLSCVFNFFEPLRFLGPDFGYVVGNLSGLKELYLDGVNISSPMPESLGMLANLTSLHLTGEIPMKIFQLQDLETLDLQSNPLLPGTCKDWSSLAATSREGFHRR
ncbi:hypothetical protein AAC387_Pa01g0620 [Persea americana]